jgi:hypothetical protein
MQIKKIPTGMRETNRYSLVNFLTSEWEGFSVRFIQSSDEVGNHVISGSYAAARRKGSGCIEKMNRRVNMTIKN